MFHILVVEDDPIISVMLEHMLAAYGWDVSKASNGMEALQSVEQRRPDLIISDIEMPVMNGIELLKASKNAPELANIPVLVLSSADREAQAWATRCDGFIAKPFRLDGLVAQLRQLLRRNASI